MADLQQYEKVQILCSCGIRSPITKLYFCKHCMKLRCKRCVSHEVDSHFCPNCLENMPSAEAKIKKNRCANCFDCPSCSHTLSTRATSVAHTDTEDQKKSTTRKVYYLACGFCRWTSRDIGMKDKQAASGQWDEKENPHAKRISDLLVYYRLLAGREKQERERKRFTRRRFMPEKSPGSRTSRRSSALMSALASLKVAESQPEKDITTVEAEASEDVEPLPAKYYTQVVVLEKVAAVEQRHMQPEFSCSNINELFPPHKHLLIKRSQRCRECEHNLSKPEFNPSSIKFKLQLIALHYIPDVRIFLVPNLHFERESQVTFLFINPMEHVTNIKLEAIEPNDKTLANSKIVVPEDELSLAAKDDTAEYDDQPQDSSQFDDNSDVVHFRRAHKLGVLVKVTPLTSSSDVIVSFLLKYDFKNISTSLRTTEETTREVTWLENEITINLGCLAQ
ncbi:dynactin subunit 4-like [Anneissia japonica]|uniref:dynactin subunit 4-like n=1 Tax=Anneissia japonica TaxID=1529436 RepID=UPI0014257CB4|nr:dynactin subunit 4-like [Anneissia japonica]